MTKERKQTGNLGEELAEKYLRKKGHRILQRNLKNKFGEIDLLTQLQETIVLVEVKAKRGLHFGLPQEMVGPWKQEKLRLLARWVLGQYPDRSIRVDVVAVDLSDPADPEIDHLENVIEF